MRFRSSSFMASKASRALPDERGGISERACSRRGGESRLEQGEAAPQRERQRTDEHGWRRSDIGIARMGSCAIQVDSQQAASLSAVPSRPVSGLELLSKLLTLRAHIHLGLSISDHLVAGARQQMLSRNGSNVGRLQYRHLSCQCEASRVALEAAEALYATSISLPARCTARPASGHRRRLGSRP